MNTLMDEYLKIGLSEIICIESTETEKQDWHGTETSEQQIIAKQGLDFVRVSGFEKHTFGPRARHNASISQPQRITREEYEQLATGKTKLDSPEIRQEFLEREAGFEKARSVKDNLESEAPTCPTHGKQMHLARGPKEYFFGCIHHPKCSEKAWLTPAQKDKARQAPYLTNVLD
jgi:ssDNA-binding Zn-finger/Zn-ribbon topoisomerase 1